MAWETLCSEVEFLTQYPEVGLAISNSNVPVPGYLFGEINAITYVDYGKNCKPLVNFLISRLEANAPLVSLKVLKLLLYLVKNGHAEIVDEVKFHEVSLKEALGFYGPPDDLHGKTFYENIRKMAKEILEFVFSEDKRTNENTLPPVSSELSGYGSSASSKNLQGFGFSVKTQKSMSEKMSDGISNFVDKLLPSIKPLETTHISHLSEALPQYKPLILNKSITDCEDINLQPRLSPVQMPTTVLRRKKKASVYKPGRPGGGWDDSEDEEEPEPEMTFPEEISQKSCTSVDSIDFSKIELKEVIVDCVDEHKVVDEFTVNEKLSNLDSAAILSLSKRCSSLNCDKILSLLVEKISENLENVQLRALIFVEYLLFHDIITLESLLRIVLPPLKELNEREEVPPAVKLKAKKITLIIENLNKICQQRQSKQPMETVVSCSS